MLKYYLALVMETPRFLWTGVASLRGVVGVASTIALFFSQELAPIVSVGEGLSRWWGAIPVAFLVILGLLRSNYERVSALTGAYDLFPGAAKGREVDWLGDFLGGQIRSSGSRAYFRISSMELRLDVPNPHIGAPREHCQWDALCPPNRAGRDRANCGGYPSK